LLFDIRADFPLNELYIIITTIIFGILLLIFRIYRRIRFVDFRIGLVFIISRAWWENVDQVAQSARPETVLFVVEAQSIFSGFFANN